MLAVKRTLEPKDVNVHIDNAVKGCYEPQQPRLHGAEAHRWQELAVPLWKRQEVQEVLRLKIVAKEKRTLLILEGCGRERGQTLKIHFAASRPTARGGSVSCNGQDPAARGRLRTAGRRDEYGVASTEYGVRSTERGKYGVRSRRRTKRRVRSTE